jgi:hypothetical protein
MAEEVKQAAERIRSGLKNDADGFDKELLVDAYLTEHSADDDEPVTVEWLTSVRPSKTIEVAVEGRIVIHGAKFGWPHCDDSWTLGRVRRLCKALGVELKKEIDDD